MVPGSVWRAPLRNPPESSRRQRACRLAESALTSVWSVFWPPASTAVLLTSRTSPSDDWHHLHSRRPPCGGVIRPRLHLPLWPGAQLEGGSAMQATQALQVPAPAKAVDVPV